MGNLHERYRLTPIINLSGPLTMYGTSISSEAVASHAAEGLRHQWDMDELFQRSGELIVQWSGAEAGMLTSSAASGCALAVAATITGCDRGKMERLPNSDGMPNEIVIQKGHVVNFGAPIEQMIRLGGGVVREVGSVNKTTKGQIEFAFGPQTAAAMFVLSHHTTQFGWVQLDEFVELCHAHGVPVIIDAAAQDHQIERLVKSGADLIVVSVQKYLSGPTAGIVCGRRELVKAVYLQNWWIGRTMKIGKEGIFGTMAALEERMATDLGEWDKQQAGQAAYLSERLQGLPGVAVSLERDQVGQPVTRVRLAIDPAVSGWTAEAVCLALQVGTPSIKPRGHHTDEGWFFLEPNHVTEEELDLTAQRLREIVASPMNGNHADGHAGDAFLAWLS
ncbi:MAG TPA: aminotransferase class V-fold PLP-dependent enzyme [Thermomicrobiales bacterium]|nr:aminotransferase class V-fold PLP-dependent enzyme [Thermomicrobiales bacterium]